MKCAVCKGSGQAFDPKVWEIVDCIYCNGTGWVKD